jgi:hypothetical protein
MLPPGPLLLNNCAHGRGVRRIGVEREDEVSILEEAPDNLKHAAQRIGATHNRLWSASLEQDPNYRDLSQREGMALAMTEAAYTEARRRLGRASER